MATTDKRPTESKPCPKCGKLLLQDGEMALDRGDGSGVQNYAVYQCDVCTTVGKFCGEDFEGPLTFAVDEKGNAFNPEDPTTDLKFDPASN